MKLNWGQSITIVIILFMAFILTLVYKMHYRNADLVRTDYYEQEVLYNDKKQSIVNYKNLDDKVKVTQKEEGIIIQFPKNIEVEKGHVQFYRADDKSLDKNYDLKLNSDLKMVLPYEDFKVGRYEINIEFNTPDKKSYLYESNIDF
jgi:Tfp pilus assembly protein PilO